MSAAPPLIGQEWSRNMPTNGVGYFTVGFPTSVMEGLWSGQGLTRERWCCAGCWYSRLDICVQTSIKTDILL